MKKFLLLITAFFITYTSFSQDFSNKGKEFWLAYCYHVGMVNSGGAPVMTLYITSDVITTYTVSIYGGATIQSGSINVGQVIPVTIPNTYFINNEGTFTNKAIHVVAAKPIVVYSYITRSQASAASLCLPTNVLGRQYYAMSYTQTSNEANANSFFTIVAVEDNTTVEIIPTVNTKNGWLANSTHTVSLNKGEIYQVLGTTNGNNGVDISGSSIKSIATATSGCKKIAVFSGSGKISIGCTGGSSDNLYQQLYPVASWGKKYLTVPSYSRINNYYRILKSVSTANVYLNGVLIAPGSFVNNYYEFLNNTPNLIESDLPIAVTQYFTTQGCAGNGSPYDPDMIVLNPVEQNINKVTLISSNLTVAGAHEHHLHIIMRNGGTGISSFRFDGNIPPGSWVTHPKDPNYSYLYIANVGETSHTLYSDSGFNALAYGYGNAETYGYSAGTNVKDLYQQIGVATQYGIETSPSVCTGAPFRFKVSLPYQVLAMDWDFHGQQTNVSVSNPSTDSTTVVNGKTLYWYSLPTYYTYNTIGTYPVTITTHTNNSDGCGTEQDIDFDLEVSNPPVADFTYVTNGCITQPVQFTNATTSVKPTYKWYWSFGDPGSGAANTSALQNPSHTFSAAGTYTVKFSDITTPGCLSDTISKQVTVTDPPIAKFGVTAPLCRGKQVTFSDTSSASAPGNIVKWYWDFGDGFTVTRTNNTDTIHTYATSGNKTVTLRVETNSGCQSILFSKTISIGAIPVAAFTLPAGICLPADSAHFFDASTITDGTQNLFTYLWNFGDPPSAPNNTSLLKDPVHYYNNAGPFNIKLIVTSGAGCVDSITKTLSNVFPQPHADFSVNAETCLNDVTAFTSNSNGNGNPITNWYWDFGDGSPVSSGQNASHAYATANTYSVKHWIKTDKGCFSDTMTKQITINPLPSAKFGISSPGCVSTAITFSDSSVANAGNIIIWKWDMDDGSPIMVRNNNSPFSYTYNATGTYHVKLTVETDKGCKSIIFSSQVFVNAVPVPDFAMTAVCLPNGSSSFTDNSTIADGTQALFTYLWDFGDPGSGALNVSTLKNPQHIYSSVGPFNITLTVTSNNGCIKSITKTLSTVYPQPHSDFSVNPENCIGDVTAFTSNSNGNGSAVTEYHWNFGDASPFGTGVTTTHTYASAGTYSVKHWIVTDKGCYSDTLTKTVTVNSLPTANFNFTVPSCETKVITFNDLSTPNSGVLNTWTWDFGDPGSGAQNTSALQSPTHTYAAAGTYTVTLTVKTDRGCQSSVFTKQVTINAQPQPGFILPEVCLSDAFAQFNDTSKITSGAITTWAWNFGDPGSGALNTSNLRNPQHRYNAVGNYTVTLIITSNNNCVSTLAQSFTVNGDIPVSNFTPLNPGGLCANDSVGIQNASTVNFGNITKVEIYWDNTGTPAVFQTDDFPTAGKVYKHLYPNFQSPLTKTFTIRYRAYSGASCVNDKIKTVTVNAAPKVQFTAIPNACLYAAPYQITQARETGGVPGTAQFTGPGISSTGIFTPATAGVGTYTLHYTFISSAGCVDTISQQITVLPPPVANFGFSTPACETKAVTFSDSSNTPAGTLTKWTWDYNDGSPVDVRSSGASFTHTFGSANTYNVKLTVTTSDQCQGQPVIKVVKINPEPVVKFSRPVVCLPNASATFLDQSTISDGTQGQFIYLWTFGDPSSGPLDTSLQKNPTHVYAAAGPYNITLSVTTNNGCQHDTTISYNDIHPQPDAKFNVSPTDICMNSSVGFIDQSSGIDTTLKSWLWNFGDGATSTQPLPVPHVYRTAGTFSIRLTVTNNNNCVSNVYTLPVKVNAFPVVDAGPDKNVLEGGTVGLEPVVTGTGLQYLWSPPDYLSSRLVKNPVVTGVDDRLYTLKVTGAGGCSDSDKVFVKVLKFPKIPNTFTPNNDNINDEWIIQYLDTYAGNRVQVFNRYGQLVFESRGYGKPWNGTMNGKPLPFGTYYYIIEPGNGRKPLTGYVTLLK